MVERFRAKAVRPWPRRTRQSTRWLEQAHNGRPPKASPQAVTSGSSTAKTTKGAPAFQEVWKRLSDPNRPSSDQFNPSAARLHTSPTENRTTKMQFRWYRPVGHYGDWPMPRFLQNLISHKVHDLSSCCPPGLRMNPENRETTERFPADGIRCTLCMGPPLRLLPVEAAQ
jgi:hypothetical protein